jgi:hypothetical protein
MREMFAWAIPLLVSLFLIQVAGEVLATRAAFQSIERGKPEPRKQTIRGPVHEVESDVTVSGIIT